MAFKDIQLKRKQLYQNKMACYSCSTKFSLLKKEKSCGKCELSFCNHCLTKKFLIGGVEKKVCEKCFHKMAHNIAEDDVEPPAILLKRLENLENPAKPPVTIFRSDPKIAILKRGLSEKDMEIADRLEKLKERKNDMSVPSVDDIKARLAALQGISAGSNSNPTVNAGCSKIEPQIAPLTSQEQVEALLMEFMEETKISGESCDSEMEDEEMQVTRVIERATAEAALPSVSTPGELTPPDFQDASDELPWCEMCNADAQLRCITCDDALFCTRCLRESHDHLELKEHTTVPFKKTSEL